MSYSSTISGATSTTGKAVIWRVHRKVVLIFLAPLLNQGHQVGMRVSFKFPFTQGWQENDPCAEALFAAQDLPGVVMLFIAREANE